MIAVISNFLAASRSVGTATTMAATGFYLHRKGFATDESKRHLAKISQQVTIPALLFTKIVYCKQDSSTDQCTSITDMLDSVWMLLFWPLYVVGCGLIVGFVVIKLTKTPAYHKPLVLASCAFPNSTGLPITLLSVIHQNYPATEELGRVDPTLFLSIYLLTYPMLQWGIGGILLQGNTQLDTSIQSIGTRSSKSASMTSAETIEGSGSDVNEHTPLRFNCPSHIMDVDKSKSDESSSSSSSGSSSTNQTWNHIQVALQKAFQPPVIGSLSGLFIGSIKSLRGIFVDMIDRNDDASLEWIFDGLYSIGQAAVPINMIILGITLSSAMQSRPSQEHDSLPIKMTISVIVAKMIVMPIIGIISSLLLRKYVWNIPIDIDDAFYLVLMIVFITPTANNVMVMVELGEKVSKEGIARLLGWQYCCAPVLLSISVSIIVYLVNSFD